jgi:hypothetical protein
MRLFYRYAAQWFIGLIVGYVILVWIGTTTGYRTMSHILMTLSVAVAGSILLHHLIKRRYWNSFGIGIALVAVVCGVFFDAETRVRTVIYMADISFNPGFSAHCHPNPGIEIENTTIQICKIYDFNRNGFVDVVAKLGGPNCCDQVIQRIYDGKIAPDAKIRLIKEGQIWEKSFSTSKLIDGFVLFHTKIDNYL